MKAIRQRQRAGSEFYKAVRLFCIQRSGALSLFFVQNIQKFMQQFVKNWEKLCKKYDCVKQSIINDTKYRHIISQTV